MKYLSPLSEVCKPRIRASILAGSQAQNNNQQVIKGSDIPFAARERNMTID
ncbi:MAG: hypothetical protein K6E54_10970 [Bacteroidaceae bacterium]|nr:hypothetical protein [Bacteroidaceae bacterium]